MISTNGFGWNFSTKQIEVSNNVWEEYARTHKDADLLRFKTHNFFEGWIECFGKDEATGEGARGFPNAEVEVNMENEVLERKKNVEGEEKPLCLMITSIVVYEKMLYSKFYKVGKKGNVSKKRKSFEHAISNELGAMVGSWLADSKDALSDIAAKLIIDVMVEKTKRVTVAVELPLVDDEAKSTITIKIVKEPQQIDVFLSYSPNSQLNFVKMLLDNKL